MGRFAAKYTPEQKAAVVVDCLDGGRTVAQAVQRAAEGLLEPHGPFEINLSYARVLVTEERNRRRHWRRIKSKPSEGSFNDLQARLFALYEIELERAEKEVREGKRPQYQRTRAIENVAKVQRRLLEADPDLVARLKVSPNLKPNPPKPKEAPAQPRSGFWSELGKAAQEPPPNPPHDQLVDGAQSAQRAAEGSHIAA